MNTNIGRPLSLASVQNYLNLMKEVKSLADSGQKIESSKLCKKHKTARMAVKGMESLGYIKKTRKSKHYTWVVGEPVPRMARKTLDWMNNYTRYKNFRGRVNNQQAIVVNDNPKPVELRPVDTYSNIVSVTSTTTEMDARAKKANAAVGSTEKPKRKYTKRKEVERTSENASKTTTYYLFGFIPFITRKVSSNG